MWYKGLVHMSSNTWLSMKLKFEDQNKNIAKLLSKLLEINYWKHASLHGYVINIYAIVTLKQSLYFPIHLQDNINISKYVNV